MGRVFGACLEGWFRVPSVLYAGILYLLDGVLLVIYLWGRGISSLLIKCNNIFKS